MTQPKYSCKMHPDHIFYTRTDMVRHLVVHHGMHHDDIGRWLKID